MNVETIRVTNDPRVFAMACALTGPHGVRWGDDHAPLTETPVRFFLNRTTTQKAAATKEG